MKHPKTYKQTVLIHKFKVPQDKLFDFVNELYAHGFIDLHDDKDSPIKRISYTDKLTSRLHRDELFKLVRGFQS